MCEKIRVRVAFWSIRDRISKHSNTSYLMFRLDSPSPLLTLINSNSSISKTITHKFGRGIQIAELCDYIIFCDRGTKLVMFEHSNLVILRTHDVSTFLLWIHRESGHIITSYRPKYVLALFIKPLNSTITSHNKKGFLVGASDHVRAVGDILEEYFSIFFHIVSQDICVKAHDKTFILILLIQTSRCERRNRSIDIQVPFLRRRRGRRRRGTFEKEYYAFGNTTKCEYRRCGLGI